MRLALMSGNVRVNIFTRARRSLWKLAARRAPGWLWAACDRTATWVHYHGPRARVRELEARLDQAQHDQVLMVRTILRLTRALEAAGAGLEPSLRLIPGGRSLAETGHEPRNSLYRVPITPTIRDDAS
jgi:hypothetical protein